MSVDQRMARIARVLGDADETGWLIERAGENGPLWFAYDATRSRLADSWTSESTEALRFARCVDAENAICWHALDTLFHVFASEHKWLAICPPQTHAEAQENAANPHADTEEK